MASGTLATYTFSSTQSTNNIRATVRFRQTTSSAGKIKLQVQAYFSYTVYSRAYTCTLQIGSSSGSRNYLNTYWDWSRSGTSYTSPWIDLTSEISNASSVTLYASIAPDNGQTAISSGAITISGIKPAYSLSISAGTGSTITVNRQSSSVADTGNLSNGAVLYADDSLKITATPNTNYGITSLKVNGTDFTSGNTHTVSSAVNVVTTAQVLASDIGATNADIESVSTITVTKYNSSYYHSIQYSFGNLSGYVTNNGVVSSSEVKFTDSSVAFSVPSSFYAEIPNSKNGTCTLTCRTYSSSDSSDILGDARNCTITVTASSSNCAPTVEGAVVDTNTVTTYLTGDSSTLVRYKSAAQCTITASPKNSATISSKSINGTTPSNDVITISGDDLYNPSFIFSATDSRGYTSSVTMTPTTIQYVKLTANPIIYRTTPTSGEVALTVSGNYFNGSFGAKANQLALGYRYRESTESAFGNWISIPNASITFSSGSYRSSSPIILTANDGSTDSFDYKKSYVFEFMAVDGYDPWSDTTYRLSTVTQTAIVKEGIPVFDWGKEDFRFNVPVYIGETKITEEQLIRLLALIS